MKKYLKLATLLVAAAISVAVVSCQKDKETEEPVASQSQNSEAKELLNRIYAFQELRDDINSGAKSGESMTLEELRDNIDLTFNFEHSQHATPFANATLDTFYVRMPQTDANGNVLAADAIATYNAFEASLENLLANVEDDSNLAKNFSIKFPETGAKNEDAIQVVFTRGINDGFQSSMGPFGTRDNYIWGKLLGYCDPSQNTGRNTDAANELTKKFQFTPDAEHEDMISLIYDIEYVMYISYKSNDFGRFIHYSDTTMTCDHDWLYYYVGDCDDEPCIEFDELNCYWSSNQRLLKDYNGALHWGPTSGSPYHECCIRWIEKNYFDYCIKAHYAFVTYAKKSYGNQE